MLFTTAHSDTGAPGVGGLSGEILLEQIPLQQKYLNNQK